jgi:hypothetical protein
VPHNSQTLSDTYWHAKELKKEILVKKSLLTTSQSYTKNTTVSTTPIKPNPQQPVLPKPPNANTTNRAIPIKPREPSKCWGYQEPWTPKHKFNCKFRRAVNAMAIDPEN